MLMIPKKSCLLNVPRFFDHTNFQKLNDDSNFLQFEKLKSFFKTLSNK